MNAGVLAAYFLRLVNPNSLVTWRESAIITVFGPDGRSNRYNGRFSPGDKRIRVNEPLKWRRQHACVHLASLIKDERFQEFT